MTRKTFKKLDLETGRSLGYKLFTLHIKNQLTLFTLLFLELPSRAKQ